MTESFVQWSPFGTYLATAHRQGIAMWGGPDFQRFQRFAHAGRSMPQCCPCQMHEALGVRATDFSPRERYLMTYMTTRDREGHPFVVLKVTDA